MSTSKTPRIAEYIDAFAKDSVKKFTWSYVDIYNRSVFSTVITLKSSSGVHPNYLSSADKILSGHSTLFKLIGLRFTSRADELKIIDHLLSKTIPIDNIDFVRLFSYVLDGIRKDMAFFMDIRSLERTLASINLINEAVLVYCWHYLNISKTNNLIDKVTEELYLLKEIEAFRKRKSE